MNEAGRVAETSPETSSAYDTEATAVLPVRHVSFASHPTQPSSVVAAFQVGKLQLAFSLETNTLLQSVKQFLDRRRASRAQ